MLEQVAPYWPAAVGVAALVATAVAVSRVILIVYRKVKGRAVRHRTAVVTDIVTPLLDERFQVVDAAILNLRLEQAATSKVLQDDVARIRSKQVKVADRIDRIYDHLIN